VCVSVVKKAVIFKMLQKRVKKTQFSHTNLTVEIFSKKNPLEL